MFPIDLNSGRSVHQAAPTDPEHGAGKGPRVVLAAKQIVTALFYADLAKRQLNEIAAEKARAKTSGSSVSELYHRLVVPGGAGTNMGSGHEMDVGSSGRRRLARQHRPGV